MPIAVIQISLPVLFFYFLFLDEDRLMRSSPDAWNVRMRVSEYFVPSAGWGVLQDQLVEVTLDNHVLYGAHGDFEEIGIGCVGEVPVNLLVGVAVQGAELVHEEFARAFPVGGVAVIVGEAMLADRAVGKLGFKEIHFIEEEDEG
jgi:hypothetical protein